MCSVTLDLISSSIVLRVFVISITSVIFIRNFILPGIRYIEISTLTVSVNRLWRKKEELKKLKTHAVERRTLTGCRPPLIDHVRLFLTDTRACSVKGKSNCPTSPRLHLSIPDIFKNSQLYLG